MVGIGTHGPPPEPTAPGPDRLIGGAMDDAYEQARLERLQGVRRGLELVHAAALAERQGRVFATEDALSLIDRLRVP